MEQQINIFLVMLKKTVTDIKPLREISLKSDKNDEYCLFSVRPGHIKEFKTTFLLIGRNFFPMMDELF